MKTMPEVLFSYHMSLEQMLALHGNHVAGKTTIRHLICMRLL